MLCELLQLYRKKSVPKSLRKDEINIMRIVIREIAAGNISSVHMTTEKAQVIQHYINYLYGDEDCCFNSPEDMTTFYAIYDKVKRNCKRQKTIL